MVTARSVAVLRRLSAYWRLGAPISRAMPASLQNFTPILPVEYRLASGKDVGSRGLKKTRCALFCRPAFHPSRVG